MGVLNPWDLVAPGRSAKLAKECVELHGAKQNADIFAPAEEWQKFPNLQVLWLNDNKIVRVENLQHNFRIRELYMQDNRVVSLQGLEAFKFLQVLRAANNQIRNLDKQLGVLKRFAFLKELDLFDNPVAEEPDYRLRAIYNLPQVELLDLKSVKHQERGTAGCVVPTLNTVVAVAHGDVVKKSKERWVNTRNEEWTFVCAERIRQKWKLSEEEETRRMYVVLGGLQRNEEDMCLLNKQNMRTRDYRVNRSYYEMRQLNGLEKIWMNEWFLTEVLGKPAGGPMGTKEWAQFVAWLREKTWNKEEFADSFFKPAEELNEAGTQPVSRLQQLWERLGKVPDPQAFAEPAGGGPTPTGAHTNGNTNTNTSNTTTTGTTMAGEGICGENPGAACPTIWRQFTDEKISAHVVMTFLQSDHLSWRYEHDESLVDRIAFLYSEAKKKGPPLGSDMPRAQQCSMCALRLEGVKTRKDIQFAKILPDDLTLVTSATEDPESSIEHQILREHHEAEIAARGSALGSAPSTSTTSGHTQSSKKPPQRVFKDPRSNFGCTVGPQNYTHLYPRQVLLPTELERGERRRTDVFPQQGLTEFHVTDRKGRVNRKCKLEKACFRFE